MAVTVVVSPGVLPFLPIPPGMIFTTVEENPIYRNIKAGNILTRFTVCHVRKGVVASWLVRSSPD